MRVLFFGSKIYGVSRDSTYSEQVKYLNKYKYYVDLDTSFAFM